jgi:hypothetical protein
MPILNVLAPACSGAGAAAGARRGDANHQDAKQNKYAFHFNLLLGQFMLPANIGFSILIFLHCLFFY